MTLTPHLGVTYHAYASTYHEHLHTGFDISSFARSKDMMRDPRFENLSQLAALGTISHPNANKPGALCLFIFLNAATTSPILMQSAGPSLTSMTPYRFFIQ